MPYFSVLWTLRYILKDKSKTRQLYSDRPAGRGRADLLSSPACRGRGWRQVRPRDLSTDRSGSKDSLYYWYNGENRANIISSSHRGQVYKGNPRFDHRLVQGQHHVHIERPQLVADLLNNFLARVLSSNIPAAKLWNKLLLIVCREGKVPWPSFLGLPCNWSDCLRHGSVQLFVLARVKADFDQAVAAASRWGPIYCALHVHAIIFYL